MRNLFLAFLLICAGLPAQVIVGNYGVQSVTSAPSGSCSSNSPMQLVQGSGAVYTCQNGTWASSSAAAAAVPGPLQFLGDGSDGAYTCTSGTCTIPTGEYWYSSFNVSAGATVSPSIGGTRMPFVIRSTGTCTIAGTIMLDGLGVTGANWGGGGGGGGGGTAAGANGTSTYGNILLGTGGSAGGGNGTTPQTALSYMQHAAVMGQFPAGLLQIANEWGFAGAAGGAGGSGGGAGGAGAAGLEMVCQTIVLTGTISAKGLPGGNSTGNSIGSGGGGGGGPIILRSPNMTNSGTITVTGGAGGTCGAFTTCGAGGAGGSGWTYVLSQ